MNKWFKEVGVKFVFVSAIALAFLGGSYYYFSQPAGPIYDFDTERDTAEVVDLMNKNRYWLSPNPDFNPYFYLKYRMPERNPLYAGKLIIKVLRENSEFIGFTAYYMKSATVGDVLFLAVRSEHRGKRHGEKLLRYAIEDLVGRGAKKVLLITRPSNTSGHVLYKRVGFRWAGDDAIHSYFEYDV